MGGYEINGKYAVAKVFADNVEEGCLTQIQTMANHPAFDLRDTGQHIAIMPDTHKGTGSVIGFTMPLTDKVVPNVIGVDIGCGMTGIKFLTDSALDLPEIDKHIRETVPMGFNIHEQPMHQLKPQREDFFDTLTQRAWALWTNLTYMGQNGKFWTPSAESLNWGPPVYSFEWYEAMCARVGMNFNRAQASIGTMGGNNHFIELGVNLKGEHWLIIHSGSRQLGSKICGYWQDLAANKVAPGAKEEFKAGVERIRNETVVRSEIQGKIAELKTALGLDKQKGTDLDYLEGENFYGYIWDMLFAQAYASKSRGAMLYTCCQTLGRIHPLDRIETIHNYIDDQDLIMRKGAVRAHTGERFILPFNRRDGTLICDGMGNTNWNQSAPHGAGRLFSRTHARCTLDPKEAVKQMEGIYASELRLDEAPEAYKSAQVIEAAISPTARIIERIKPILNIKASEEPPRRRKGQMKGN